ncbi:GlxA family transcriptional regulator [Knoellia subterranea]|uniref:AraC family transcriptional regulator n=1 Tax=Knoellia subterranea KCTC 19937 TaxID=1385521 RepID=A0A0A0JNA0_9MICO|nr:helix-turn-helix domain-containing protein [Knoellia subterranea]KGN37096.1 AraC family transcriptional regulator [Knoellia subterranea KCTC 19937]
MNATRRVLVVGYPGAELVDIACVTSTLQIANHLKRQHLYRVELASPGGAPIRTATGLTLQSDLALESVRGPLDTLIVSGGLGFVEAMDDDILVAHVRRLARETRRVASVCTGSGILAAAGLLTGRRAATHWHHADYLSRRFPDVHFDEAPIFVTDDGICTSAGVTAALDQTLAFVEADAGAELARAVARHLVTYLQRPGNQAQMSMFTAAPPPQSELVRDTVDFVESHLGEDLSTTALARRVGVSERHLGRLFHESVGTSPGRYVRRCRVEAAAHLLTTTRLTVEAITARCGLGTVETLRQAFHSRYGVSPSHYRATQMGAASLAG